MGWVNCKECVYFQERDCDEVESRDGCYFGMTEEELDFKEVCKMKNKNRLIYAGEALDRLMRLSREPYYQHEGEDWSVGVSMACGEVHECAIVDAVAVVHGQWVEINQHKDVEGWIECDYVCSACGEVAGEAYNYCPNCGAKMDGGNEDGSES